MASSDFPWGVGQDFGGSRLIPTLTAVEPPSTPWDLIRCSRLLPFVPSLATPGAVAVALSHASIATVAFVTEWSDSATPRPDSPSNSRPATHNGATRSLSVRPEGLPVASGLGAQATCRVCFDETGYPIAPDPRLPGSWVLARKRTFHLLGYATDGSRHPGASFSPAG